MKSELGLETSHARGDSIDLSEAITIDLIIQQLLLRRAGQAAQTIARSLRDAQAHQVALLAGCRAIARSTLEQFSPQRLHWQFEQEHTFWPLTAGRRWRAYVNHHRALTHDDSWSTGLWAHDFVDAYDEQIRLINIL